MIISQEVLKRQHNGLLKTPAHLVGVLMPDFKELMDTAPINLEDYVADVKIHMLMPNMWPCIPNWHYDLVPRDSENKQDFSNIDTTQKMLLYVSGPPVTEFRDSRKITPGEWHEFTQIDEHRGVKSDAFQWRVFIRLAPKTIYQAAPESAWVRFHSQVYLEPDFSW